MQTALGNQKYDRLIKTIIDLNSAIADDPSLGKGFRVGHRKNFKELPGKPDIAITKYHIAIFCDSEFWHGYDWENARERIHTNRNYWIPKIEKNILRDNQVNKTLAERGWTVLRFWEKQIRKDIQSCVNTIIIQIEEQKKQGAINENW